MAPCIWDERILHNLTAMLFVHDGVSYDARQHTGAVNELHAYASAGVLRAASCGLLINR
jgi:hypothetical protein